MSEILNDAGNYKDVFISNTGKKIICEVQIHKKRINAFPALNVLK